VIKLTADETFNGWTAESLEAYRRERDKVADKVGGNTVTEFKRGRQAVQMQGAGRAYDPFMKQYRS
jgi:hypothetical protein